MVLAGLAAEGGAGPGSEISSSGWSAPGSHMLAAPLEGEDFSQTRHRHHPQ